jgi:hypothetical protein
MVLLAYTMTEKKMTLWRKEKDDYRGYYETTSINGVVVLPYAQVDGERQT